MAIITQNGFLLPPLSQLALAQTHKKFVPQPSQFIIIQQQQQQKKGDLKKKMMMNSRSRDTDEETGTSGGISVYSTSEQDDDGSSVGSSVLDDFDESDEFDSSGERRMEEEEHKRKLSGRESDKVRLSMAIVLGMLLVTAALVVVFTYLFLSAQDEAEFSSSVSY